jgi:O-antigen/teichoic acid export membrane protein
MARPDSLKLNLLLLYAGELFGKALGLSVFGYLGRMLTPGRYGDLEFAIGILFLLNLFMEAGLDPYGAREASKHPDRIRALAAQIFVIRAGVLALALGLLFALYAGLDRDPVARTLILAYGLVLLPVPLLLNWAFQARDEMVVVAGSNLLRQVLLAGLAFTLVHGPEDVLWVPVADACGLSTALLMQQFLFRRRAGPIQPLAHLAGLGNVVRQSAPIAASSLLWSLRIFAPLIALGLFTSSEQTGVFGAGHRLIVALHTFVWLYFFNLLPSIARVARPDALDDYRRLLRASFELVAWVVLAGACVGSSLAPWLIPLVYGERLGALASGPFGWMLWMLVAAFLSGHHRFSLIAFERQRRELLGSVAGACFTLGCCLVLRSALTPELAAGIFVCSETLVLLVAAGLLRAELGALGLLRPLVGPLLATAAALAVLSHSELTLWLRTAAVAGCFAVALAVLGRGLPGRMRALRTTQAR